MSEHPYSEHSSAQRQERDYPRTDRFGQDRSRASKNSIPKANTVLDQHHESPTKYDIDYYQRRVNRLENELSSVQQQLSITKFRLQKAQDFENKHQQLFNKYQDLNESYDSSKQDLILKTREANQLKSKLDQSMMIINSLDSNVENMKMTAQGIRKKKDEEQNKASNQGAQEKAEVQKVYLRQIDNLRSQGRSKEDKLKKELAEAQFLISSKDNAQNALKFKLERIKGEKNDEINRLKNNISSLKKQLSESSQRNDERVINQRTQLIEETQSRIASVRSLTMDIQNTLIEQIRNLNEAIAKKDTQIEYLLEADRKHIKENEQTQNDLKAHIKRLQDKIFTVQRQNEIQLFNTVQRLKKQYDENIDELNRNFDQIRNNHKDHINDLNSQITSLQQQHDIMAREAKSWEEQHKKLSLDKQFSVKMLSQKIIGLEQLKDEDLRNYTTSMRNIEEDAKNKMQDLHSAVQSKNNQFEILTSQINLKNSEINTLLEDIQQLRNQNRQKMRKLETTNGLEQNTLNQLVTSYKKEVLQLKRRVHQLQSEMSDAIAQVKLKYDLMRQDLNNQKQANQLLRGRNQFLNEWCKELDGGLKKQRMSNVDVLHDHTVSRRQTIQMREHVRVQLEAIKERQIEQIRNIFKLEKGRLQSDLIKREQELNTLRAENNRLLTEYKNLERKVGKPSKLDKGSQEQGKCRATLQAQILLTQNIFNAINRP